MQKWQNCAEAAIKTLTRYYSITKERLYQGLETLDIGFAIFDSDHKLVTCNAAFCDIYAGIDLLIEPGVCRCDILRASIAAGLMKNDGFSENCLENLRDMWSKQYNSSELREFTDGRIYRIINQHCPSGDVVVQFHDMTMNQTRLRELEQTAQTEAAANHAKSDFLASISHEIRTPMNGVIGMAELLSDTPLNPEQRQFANTIKNSAEALLIIINDILDYSKIEANQMEIFNAPFNLEETIHEVSLLLEIKAAQKGIELLIDYDMFLPTCYIGDGGRIRQIILNFISNAIKFTQKGYVLVRVIGLEIRHGMQQLHIVVEDTGIGLPPEKLDLIFEEFTQVDCLENRKNEGTGLGLSISRRLVDLMNGELWVDSKIGQGSSFGFKLCLPIHADQNAKKPKLRRVFKRAMLVDDSAANRLILQKQFDALNIKTRSFSSGESALASYQKDKNYDLILTDHCMPGMDGIEFGKAIRAAGYGGTLCAMSSQSYIGQIANRSEIFNSWMQKPSLRQELYQALNIAVLHTEQTATQPKEMIKNLDVNLNVILAEDNKTNQKLFEAMLKDYNVALRIVDDGQECLAAFQQEQPDLIFMDISMPNMNGVVATQKIRHLEVKQNLSQTPIIGLSAHASHNDRERFLINATQGYLTKPFKKKQLLAELQNRAEQIILERAKNYPK